MTRSSLTSFYFTLSGAEVVAEYDYDALHEDELTLRPGDVIKDVHYVEEDGWMEGDLNGRRGLFPDNFVKVRGRAPRRRAVTRTTFCCA